jgi:hypothetical protein
VRGFVPACIALDKIMLLKMPAEALLQILAAGLFCFGKLVEH